MASVKPYESDWAFEARLRRRIRNLILVSVALLISLLFFFPVYLMFSSSFKSEGEIFAIPMHWIPHEFQGFRQYEFAFEKTRIERWYINSLLIAAVQTIATVFFGALAGYGFAKFRFPGRNILFLFILSIMTVPFQILVIPMFVLVHQLGWHNTYEGIIMPGLISAFGVFMMRQFFRGLPKELDDAARVDGAGEFRIFWQIMLPLVKPALVVMAVFTFVWTWHDFFRPLIYLNDPDQFPLSLGLYAFRGRRLTEWHLMMAAATLMTAPLVILFAVAQKYFVRGMRMFGIKG